jgi:F-type H+-transporting ATPase subunit delta
MSLLVASRYARAFADAVFAPASGLTPEQVVAELRSFEAQMAASPELTHVLLSPAVSPKQKRGVVSRFAERLPLHRLTRNLLYVMIDHGRARNLAATRAEFEKIVDEKRGLARVEVTLAREPDAMAKNSLEGALATRLGRQVRCEYKIDPGLIGGAVAKVGSTVYDGSVKGQLDAMRRRLARA